ncbi:MAG: MFS transporter [Planctomycetaceae bacterium]|nr:MFS transporter [Planctomycetaceae bacterium]
MLGLVSLFMDVSSEMIHALLPVFLVSVLGAGAGAVGLIEGIAEATASITKVFSGVWSDRVGRRKPLAVLGYGLAALTKPLFPLATSTLWVFVARFTDRIGKGIRGAPRDAMIADATAPDRRGAAFGLRQSLDSAGAFLGPLIAVALLGLLSDDIRQVFWVAVIPAFAAVAILVFGVREPGDRVAADSRALPQWRDVRRLGSRFWIVATVGVIFSLARFSEAFLVLRASDVGVSVTWIPLTFVVMNVVYFAAAYPIGWLSDRLGRLRLLAAGLIVLILSDVVLALGDSIAVVMVGIAIWGLHMGMTQGLLSTLVADAAPEALRGSAFGVFYFTSGIASLAASVVAGVLWQWVGPALTFMAGAGFSAAAIIGLVWWGLRDAPSRV